MIYHSVLSNLSSTLNEINTRIDKLLTHPLLENEINYALKELENFKQQYTEIEKVIDVEITAFDQRVFDATTIAKYMIKLNSLNFQFYDFLCYLKKFGIQEHIDRLFSLCETNILNVFLPYIFANK